MRAGSSAMTARRSVSLICAQPAISASVRPQPRQVPVAVLSSQILTQGVSKIFALGRSTLKECRGWRACEQIAPALLAWGSI